MINEKLELFFNKLTKFIDEEELIKLILSNKKDKSSDLKTITISIVKLKKGISLSFVLRHNTNDVTKNYNFEEGKSLIKEYLEKSFYNAEVFSNTENLILTTTKKGFVSLKVKKASLKPLMTFSHDKPKNRLIKTKNNIYLKELGITTSDDTVIPSKTDKYRQINRYVELLVPYINHIQWNDSLHIVDMGSGKGYLTFALYDYIENSLDKKIKMTGVEFRKELVGICNNIAKKSNFNNLNFVEGTIEKAKIDNVDVLIALHACDTATDEAIFRGISSNSSLIVCAPCCHKQIRRAFDVTNELSSVVKHGILKERQAEIITDTLRALIMEVFGYKTKIFEFISDSHTPKNLMIVGEKSTIEEDEKKIILKNISDIKKMYGIKEHYLEKLLSIS